MLSLGCERYAPIAPGPIDFCRRRQLPIIVKRVQSTLPRKTRVTKTQDFNIVQKLNLNK